MMNNMYCVKTTGSIATLVGRVSVSEKSCSCADCLLRRVLFSHARMLTAMQRRAQLEFFTVLQTVRAIHMPGSRGSLAVIDKRSSSVFGIRAWHMHVSRGCLEVTDGRMVSGKIYKNPSSAAYRHDELFAARPDRILTATDVGAPCGLEISRQAQHQFRCIRTDSTSKC